MVVVKLVGANWDPDDKIVLALDARKTIKMQITTIQKKLGLDSFVGWCLYRTEGKPPGVVRPTVPIQLNNVPAKENIQNGCIIWAKQADLDTQERDKTMHESLKQYRQEHGITALKQDGSDVAEFEDAMKFTLNAVASRDISDLEKERRTAVEVAECRDVYDITFEHRLLESLKKEEREAREAIFKEIVDVLEREHCRIKTLFFKRKLQQLVAEESTVRRRDVEAAQDAEFSSLRQAESSQRVAIIAAETQALKLAAASGKGGGGMSKEDYDALVKLLKDGKNDTLSMVSSLEERVESQLRTVLATVERMTQRSVQEMVTALRCEINDATSRTASSGRRENDEIVQRKLEELEHEVASSLPKQASFFVTSCMEDEREIEIVRELLREQNELLMEQEQLDIQEAQREDERAKVVASTAENALLASLQSLQITVQKAVESLAHAQDGLRIEFLREREEEANEKVEETAAQHRKAEVTFSVPAKLHLHEASAEGRHRFAANSLTSMHPGACRVILTFIDRHIVFPPKEPQAEEQMLSLIATQRPVSTCSPHEALLSEFTNEVVIFFCELRSNLVSPYAIADYLCFHCGIVHDPAVRRKLLRCAEFTKPHLVSVLDLLIELYSGREVELALALLHAAAGDSLPLSSSRSVGGICARFDPTSERWYYAHDKLELSQWLRPVGMKQAEISSGSAIPMERIL